MWGNPSLHKFTEWKTRTVLFFCVVSVEFNIYVKQKCFLMPLRPVGMEDRWRNKTFKPEGPRTARPDHLGKTCQFPKERSMLDINLEPSHQEKAGLTTIECWNLSKFCPDAFKKDMKAKSNAIAPVIEIRGLYKVNSFTLIRLWWTLTIILWYSVYLICTYTCAYVWNLHLLAEDQETKSALQQN